MRTPSRSLPLRRFVLVFALVALATAAEAQQVAINEIRINQPGADTDEYFELKGTGNEALTDVWYVVIGDGVGSGTVEAAINLTGNSLRSDGLFLVAEQDTVLGAVADLVTALNFENSDNVTHMLVTSFTGMVGQDLDTNDDCVLDIMPWTTQLDVIAVILEDNPPTTTECHYGPPTVGPDGNFAPGHVFFCTAWLVGAFDPIGGDDTPGAENVCQVPPGISNVLQRPLWVEPAEAVTVTADVVDQDGTVSAVRLFVQENGGGFSASSMTLSGGDTYTGTIAGRALNDVIDYYIEAEDNDGNIATNPEDAPTTVFSYTVQNEVITPIADIHADIPAFTGSLVVVQAQVYCPGDYQMDGSSVSAYIQDNSDRGINVFGTLGSTGFADLNDTGNIVKVTGTVTLFFSTVELTNYEVELISTGNPPLSPDIQASVADAASPNNEGTYIQASGVVQSIEQTGGVNPATNFSITDCGGTLVLRVDDDLLPMTLPVVGDSLMGSGAGANFQGTGQILVCSAAELVNHGFVGSICPSPVLITEIMRNPNALPDSVGEWFEIQNVSGNPVDMNGWTIRDDGSDSHVIDNGGPLVIEPGEFQVIGGNADTMATQGVTLFYAYGRDIVLGNSIDEIVLVDMLGVEVNRVEYTDARFPDAAGASMQWDGTGSNNDGCLGHAQGVCNWYGFGQGPTFGDGDRGTPGAANTQPSSSPPGVPLRTSLHQNTPNPFNPITTFSFTLASRERASLVVYDVRGKKVRTILDEVLEPGLYTRYTWDGRDENGRRVNSGIYLYQLETGSGFSESRKMVVLK